MRVEQAVFSSARDGRGEGYHVVASSPGLSPEDRRELSVWGPAHDSLSDSSPQARSFNFHSLASGTFCVSRTTCEGSEYSGRGGRCVLTQSLVFDRDLLARFSFHPIRLFEALETSGRMTLPTSLNEPLPALQLIGRASPFSQTEVLKLVKSLGCDKLVSLLSAVLTWNPLALLGKMLPERTFSGLLYLLPPSNRAEFSFCTGLKLSPRRPFRLAYVPDDPALLRRYVRQSHVKLMNVDSTRPVPGLQPATWAARIGKLLGGGDLDQLERLVLQNRLDRKAEPIALEPALEFRSSDPS